MLLAFFWQAWQIPLVQRVQSDTKNKQSGKIYALLEFTCYG